MTLEDILHRLLATNSKESVADVEWMLSLELSKELKLHLLEQEYESNEEHRRLVAEAHILVSLYL